MHWLVLVCGPLLVLAIPRFDPTAILRNVLIPADAAVDSIIYRLRASDPSFDYPLLFDVQGKITIASIDTLNCTRFNSVCQANVILKKKLEPGRFYDFRVMVTNRRGDSSVLDCSFRATNATTPIGVIFPGAPTLLMVSENARRNTELGTMVAKGNPSRDKPVLLELWGSPQFSLRQRMVNEKDAEGTILLLGQLDYETKTVHHITILANDPWTEPDNDSRNIAMWSLLVAVLDEQDTPPVFTLAPPTTNMDPALRPGDVVLRVKAEDGDKGKPRDIRYGLVSEGNPFTPFFDLSEDTGELRLIKPLSDIQAITHSNTPILLTVVAEEVRSGASESPAQSSTVRLALIPPPPIGSNPRFTAREFTTSVDENAVPGTILKLNGAELIAQTGLIFTLELINNNGTFDVSPNVVEGKSKFMIKVRDNILLDYESRHSVQCDIYAKELGEGTTNHTAISHLIVNLNDLNDNPPQFREIDWKADIPENAVVGTTVLRIQASDIDGNNKNIRFTRIFGPGSEYFRIEPSTGVITVGNSDGLDSEKTPTLTFSIEAADDEGNGNTAVASITVNLIDVNDEIPQFEKNPYEFILKENRRSFTIPAFITALDSDITAPNNEIRYELIESVDNITLHAVTGELTIKSIWNKNDITVLRARAYDGGVPRLWTECEIRVYPPEGRTRKMIFIVSGKDPDKDHIEDYLTSIVGGKVAVDRIRPYDGKEPGAIDISRDAERSVVETTVTYSRDSIIDIDRLHTILDRDRLKHEEIKSAESNNLWWIILTIFLLMLLIALILLLCCLLEGCPLFVAKKRRTVTPTDGERLVTKAVGTGQDSKSVQVAEWYGRREAWTPEHNMLDVEVDSMRRHELERGSERGGVHRVHNRHMTDSSRDQLYIREGNTDILRLITRGGEQQQRPVTLVPEQAFLIDSGKDILMRRFIDQQQQSEAVRTSNAYHQNTLNRIQNDHELLEESLRQQNVLLRQILLERERDLRLETQSLPAGTQTDQNVSTQTEPLYLRPPRRQTRSDNDASDGSDEEERYIRARRRRNIRKSSVKRKIRTPIQEESESNHESIEKQKSAASVRVPYNQTKSSLLRQMAAQKARSKSSSNSRSIQKEVLQEISDSLNQTESESENHDQPTKKKEKVKDIQTQGTEAYYSDSLDEEPPNVETTVQKYHSENDLRFTELEIPIKQAISQTDIRKAKSISSDTSSSKIPKKSSSRYMEWYNKNNELAKSNKSKREETRKDRTKLREKEKEKEKDEGKPIVAKVSKRLLADTQSSSRKKIELPTAPGPEHPLIQHSKNRFEVTIPKRIDEDVDSGIALTRPAMAQKKSVFTIAYADMQMRQLPDSVSTTP